MTKIFETIWHEEAEELLDNKLEDAKANERPVTLTLEQRKKIIDEIAEGLCEAYNEEYDNLEDWLYAEHHRQKQGGHHEK